MAYHLFIFVIWFKRPLMTYHFHDTHHLPHPRPSFPTHGSCIRFTSCNDGWEKRGRSTHRLVRPVLRTEYSAQYIQSTYEALHMYDGRMYGVLRPVAIITEYSTEYIHS